LNCSRKPERRNRRLEEINNQNDRTDSGEEGGDTMKVLRRTVAMILLTGLLTISISYQVIAEDMDKRYFSPAEKTFLVWLIYLSVPAIVFEGIASMRRAYRSRNREATLTPDFEEIPVLLSKLADSATLPNERSIVRARVKRISRATPAHIVEICSLLGGQQITDEDRKVLLDALGGIGDSAGITAGPCILPLVASTSRTLRYRAIETLGRIVYSEAFEILVALLQDSDKRVRMKATVAISRFKRIDAVPHLIPLLQDPEVEVQHCVEFALKVITGKKFGYDIEKWREWWATQVVGGRKSVS
jgi:hypothetical protein